MSYEKPEIKVNSEPLVTMSGAVVVNVIYGVNVAATANAAANANAIVNANATTASTPSFNLAATPSIQTAYNAFV